MSYNIENPKMSSTLLNRSFIRKLDEGLVKEAEREASNFIRTKLRQESFAREILPPQPLAENEIDIDEYTDLPKKIVELEPDSSATFVPFKGTGPRTWFKGDKYAVYFGKITTKKFTKSRFELMTYQNDIRKILSDNSVKDMADEEDLRFYDTCKAIIAQAPTQDLDLTGTAYGTTGALSATKVRRALQELASRKLPPGKLLMSKELFYTILDLEPSAASVGDSIAAQHYKEGVESEEKLWGIPVITTIKSDIVPANEFWMFPPSNFLGNFFLLQDATLFLKSEADMIEFWSYSAPGIGIGNTKGVIRGRV